MIHAGQLNIGPLQFVLQAPDGASVSYADPAYAGFWTENMLSPAGAGALVSLMVSVSHVAMTIPDDAPAFRGGRNWALWTREDHLVICSGFEGRSAARAYCRLARDFSKAEVMLDPARECADGLVFNGPLQYPVDQILTWGLLSRCRGFILHASVAVKDGVGWVFTGRSGAGKSTISGLCHDAGWQILNDDRVIIYPRDGRYRVSGTPWHGSGRFAEAADVPLGGIFFLVQSRENRVEPFPSSSQARLSLLDVAAIPWFEDAWSQDALDAVDLVADNVVLHRLHFTRDAGAVHELERHLFQDSGRMP